MIGKRMLLVACTIIMSMALLSHAEDINAVTLGLLKDGGAETYAEKAPYGAGIDSLLIGYNAEGTPIVGVAVRETKTYKKVHTIVSLNVVDGTYRIAAAEIPDIDAIPGKAKSYAEDALKDITGRVFQNTSDARKLVDAVTGASKYYKAIYISYGLMASKLIEELEANPDWERKPLSSPS